jgi:hypothetical protein
MSPLQTMGIAHQSLKTAILMMAVQAAQEVPAEAVMVHILDGFVPLEMFQ